MIDPQVRKEIVRNLHSAIDSEILDQDEKAYQFYIESLLLVVNVLKEDTDICNLSQKDKCNLIEFGKQSVARVGILLKKGTAEPPQLTNVEILPSAPSLTDISPNKNPEKEEMIMSRYHRRYSLASGAFEKSNIQVDLARDLVEKAAATRNQLMQSTAWAMQTAHRQFRIQEKLQNGTLTELDLRMQQLYALSLQFNHGNCWLVQMAHNLNLCPSNTKLVREVLDNVLTDNSHPIKATINKMQEKINMMVNSSMDNPNEVMNDTKNIAAVIKEDLFIILEVLKALFVSLDTEKNAALASEVLYHVYFSQLKQNLVMMLRFGLKNPEDILNKKMIEMNGFGSFEATEGCKEAITKLHYLTTLHNPYDMLDCTVHIVKLLATSDFDKSHCTSVGADDLLPRLCKLLLLSSLPSICSEAAFMEIFTPSEKALGEEGYAVTMLQSAIAHLTTEV